MSSEQQPQIIAEDGVTIVSFANTVKMINEDYVAVATAAMLEAAERDPPLLVVDLDGIEFFSSSFIEALFRTWNRMKKRSGRFAICNLYPYCLEVLEITNLHSLWTICNTRQEAIDAVKSADQS